MKKVVCFGDSITARERSEDGTERLVPRLRSAFAAWDIINAGISGNNTRDALARIQEDVLDHHPDLVILLLGANDVALHKQIDLDEYEANLFAIVSKIGFGKTILITPSPVDESRPSNRTNEIMRKYADSVVRVAQKSNNPCIDLFSSMFCEPRYCLMLSDGLHFEASGYHYLTQLIIAEVLAYDLE